MEISDLAGRKRCGCCVLVMNLMGSKKFRKFLHQLKKNVIYKYDLLLMDFVSQVVRYNYLSVKFLRPLRQAVGQIS